MSETRQSGVTCGVLCSDDWLAIALDTPVLDEYDDDVEDIAREDDSAEEVDDDDDDDDSLSVASSELSPRSWDIYPNTLSPP